MQKWVKARDDADFSQFAPVLQEWVDLLKSYATAIDSSRPIYDVLLDDYEKGMTSSRLNEIFTEVSCLLVECMFTYLCLCLPILPFVRPSVFCLLCACLKSVCIHR